MLPVKVLRLFIADLLAADTTSGLSPASPLKVALVKAPFVPSENLLAGDLTLATFTGGAAKSSGQARKELASIPRRARSSSP